MDTLNHNLSNSSKIADPFKDLNVKMNKLDLNAPHLVKSNDLLIAEQLVRIENAIKEQTELIRSIFKQEIDSRDDN